MKFLNTILLFKLKLVCVIVENETDVAAFKDYQPPSEEDSTLATVSTQEESPNIISPPTSTFQTTAASADYVPISSASLQPTEKVLASPYARKLAAERGIDLKVYTSGIEL